MHIFTFIFMVNYSVISIRKYCGMVVIPKERELILLSNLLYYMSRIVHKLFDLFFIIS